MCERDRDIRKRNRERYTKYKRKTEFVRDIIRKSDRKKEIVLEREKDR